MVKQGDLALVEYTVSTGGTVVDTSRKDVAAKNGLSQEGREYRPLTVFVGSGDVISGFDAALKEMSKGERKAVKVKAKEGYGERNPELVKILPLKVFKDNKIEPVPGMVLNLDNMPARIQSVSGGRVRVDFNHELAGRDLEFDLEVLDVLESDDAKLASLSDAYFGKGAVKTELKAGRAKVTAEKAALRSKEYSQSKQMLLAQALGKMPGIKAVEFTEIYEKE